MRRDCLFVEFNRAYNKATDRITYFRVDRIIRTRFKKANFRSSFVKILVNPTGFTAFLCLD